MKRKKFKHLDVTIKGIDETDLKLAIDEVKKLVSKGFVQGVNANETGSYSFGIVEDVENRKCIVKGCENMTTEGFFYGKICHSCYEMLISGEVGNGKTFIHKLSKK